MRRIHRSLGLTALLLSGVAAAQSTDVEARLRAQLRDTAVQLRQAQDDNATLRAQQQDLQRQLQVAGSAPRRTEADSGLRRQLTEREARIAELSRQLAEAREQLTRAQGTGQRAGDLLRQHEEEESRLRAAAQAREAAYQSLSQQVHACEDKNAQLITISSELLSAYEKKGVWSAIRDAEPLTGIHRVQLETLAQDYHIRIKDRTVSPAPPAQSQPK